MKFNLGDIVTIVPGGTRVLITEVNKSGYIGRIMEGTFDGLRCSVYPPLIYKKVGSIYESKTGVGLYDNK